MEHRKNRQLVRLLLLTGLVLSLVPLAPSRAATTRDGMQLSRSSREVAWTGSVENAAVGDASACELPAAGCPSWMIDVDASWSPDRLVVAIDNRDTEIGWDFGYDLNLALYGPDGKLIEYATSPFESQVIVVEKPTTGTYKAVAVPRFVVGKLPFNGYAALAKGGTKSESKGPARDLLPNLVAEPPSDIQIAAPPASFFAPAFWEWRGARGPSSCYAQERIEQGAKRCLRFSQTVGNVGAGALVLRMQDAAAGTMLQRVERSDGSTRDQTVGEVEFHAAHGHFHYAGWAETRLYEADEQGRKGALVRTGRKQGFCMADVRNLWFGQPRQVPPRYIDPRACDGQEELTGSQVGMSIGWADTYPWFYADQFVEISGIPDGRYILEFVVNQSRDGVLETTWSDNSAASLIKITGNDVKTLRPST